MLAKTNLIFFLFYFHTTCAIWRWLITIKNTLCCLPIPKSMMIFLNEQGLSRLQFKPLIPNNKMIDKAIAQKK